MTDRHSAYIVTLDHDLRADDAEPLLNAIRLLSGVVDVAPVVADVTGHIAEARARSQLRTKLWQTLEEPL